MTMETQGRDGRPARPWRVLVTGAGGCVGSKVVELLLARGYRVIAAELPGVNIPEGPLEQLDIRLGDLADPDYAAALADGADAVIHTAALIDTDMTWEQIEPVNLAATVALYNRASAGGAAKFIHFSTGSLYLPGDRALRETDALAALNPCCLAKLLAEEFLLSSRGSGPVVNILRPGLVFGPCGKVLINLLAVGPAILKMFTNKAPLLKGGPRTNPVHSLDAARAAVHLLESDQQDGEVFNIAGPEPVDSGTMLNLLFSEAGFKPAEATLTLPLGLLGWIEPVVNRKLVISSVNRAMGFLWCMARRGRRRGHNLRPHLNPQFIAFMTTDVIFDVSKLLATGFTFHFDRFEPAWRDMYRWFRTNEWLPQ